MTWLAVIDAKSLSVAASASVDSAIFPAKTRTLQRCAALFAAASCRHPAKLYTLRRPGCPKRCQCRAGTHLLLPLLQRALSPADKMCYSRSAINHLKHDRYKTVLPPSGCSTSTKPSFGELVCNSVAHESHIACPCWLGLLMYYPNTTHPVLIPILFQFTQSSLKLSTPSWLLFHSFLSFLCNKRPKQHKNCKGVLQQKTTITADKNVAVFTHKGFAGLPRAKFVV